MTMVRRVSVFTVMSRPGSEAVPHHGQLTS